MDVGRFFGGTSTVIIAEIGTSHGGELGHARELVDAAAEAGADCVKTQIVYADEIVHPLTGRVSLPGGEIPLYERFRELEVSPAFFAALAEHCGRRGVTFLASVFGRRSLEVLGRLRGLGVDAVKIASPELNHLPLLHAVAETGLEIVLSTGVATLSDIERAVDACGDACGMLHCVTAYPAPEEEYNLRVVPALRQIFGVGVGVSDHSTDPVLVPAAAVSLGADVIEKHLTLSREGNGLDDRVALEPAAFSDMVRAVRRAERQGPEHTFGELRERYGASRLEKVLGDGVKRLAPSEKANYGRSNRSILATADIPEGEPIDTHNAAILRSEHNLTPGLSPSLWERIRGARAVRPIENGTGVRFDHLLTR
ncbi:MAG: N-acetylneuraminate synthase family protein [Spirochaetaceae bacterium]